MQAHRQTDIQTHRHADHNTWNSCWGEVARQDDVMYPLISAVPGTERHDWEDVDDLGV